ncbi:MAG: amidohydrolase family protein [Chloroflexi bacterium]|nr:amidohydrolase family protein [Chloroflexota bacterium]
MAVGARVNYTSGAMTVRLGSRSVRVIDCHAHLGPPEWRVPSAPASMFEIEKTLAELDRAGVDVSVFGNNWIRVPEGAPAIEAVRRYNAFAAEVTARYPGRLMGLASAVPFGDDQHLVECERAIRELGLKGIMVSSSVAGEYLDSPSAHPFFDMVAALEVPVFVHPPRVTIGAEKMEIFRLPEMVGRPFDTTLSFARFILNGGFEHWPSMKLVGAHMGGAVSLLPGRLDFGYELRDDLSFGPWEPDVLTAPPSAYIPRLYVDTMGFHPPAVMCCVETVGAEHVVMGSDFPPVHVPVSRTVDLVRNLPLSLADREAILGGNAAALLRI